MDQKEKEIRQHLKNDFPHYANKCLKIATKEGSIITFSLNKAQKYIHARIEEQKNKTGRVRAIILKGRQQGCSTYVGGRFYHKVTHNFGIKAFILTHALDATNNLFKMAKRFYEHTPAIVQPEVSANNTKELIFGKLDSGYKLGTAENKSVGRSSTIQLFHGSEVAFWSNAAEHAKGILQAIPDVSGTEIILESTANGVGNYFHQQWQMAEAGKSEYTAIFIPWYWQEEYKKEIENDFCCDEEEDELKRIYHLSDEQINWRRNKIIELSVKSDGKKSFMQEYPCNTVEAFQMTGEDSYISPQLVAEARNGVAEKYGKLLIGVDPARFGDDHTCIIRRQTRHVFGLQRYKDKDTMEVTGYVHKIITEEKPFRVFIDVGGLGAGIVDRLIELGHKEVIVPINSGSKPLDDKKYGNKRAEMWGVGKEWLINHPCQIPDDDVLHADLTGVKYRFDSNSRLFLERKEDMKKRGIRSPDAADALMLTFAYPESVLVKDNSQDRQIARKITTLSRKLKYLREQK